MLKHGLPVTTGYELHAASLGVNIVEGDPELDRPVVDRRTCWDERHRTIGKVLMPRGFIRMSRRLVDEHVEGAYHLIGLEELASQRVTAVESRVCGRRAGVPAPAA